MRIVDRRTYQGANCLLPVPAISLVVDLGSDTGDIDPSRLNKAVSAVNKAIASLDNPFTPARMTPMPTGRSNASSVGAFMAELALVLQRQFVCSAWQSRATREAQTGRLVVAYECRHSRLGMLAGDHAVGICDAALSGSADFEGSLAASIEEFRTAATNLVPTIETRLLLLEADRRGIPWFRLAQNIPVVQLGQGHMRQRFRNSLTDETGDTAYRLSSFKPLGAHLLHELGLPVPRQGSVETEEQAVAVGRRLGYPVVIKPVGMDMGVGVHIGIAGETELREAYRSSRVHGPLQVEQHLAGFDHRFTFIRGRLIGVVRTTPPIIEGDGTSTVRQLLEAEPVGTATIARRKIILDEEVVDRIRAAGYVLDDELPAGERIVLRAWWRNKPDHMLENVTAGTHPENIDAALLATEAVGLDVAGVDYITTDISRPFHETGGAFTEVNPMPAMAGTQRAGIPAYPMLLQALFPGGETGRIDTVVLLGQRGAEAIAAGIESLLSRAGHRVGIATGGRLEVAGRSIRREGIGEVDRGRTILRHPRPTAAILQATEAAIVQDGLALERCKVGVFLMADDVAPASGMSVDASETARLLCATVDEAVVIDVEDSRAALAVADMPEGRIMWMDSTPGGAQTSLRRPGDPILTARRHGEKCSIAIDDGSGSRPLVSIELPSTGDATADREACRIRLMVFGAGIALGIDAGTLTETSGETRPKTR